MTVPRDAISAADVLGVSELTDIVVYEVAARRLPDDGADVEPADEFSVNARSANESFETRGRLYLRTTEAEFVVEVGAIYILTDSVRLPPHVAAEFIERVGVMALYPFVREQVFSAARRLGVGAPILGLLRAGQFRVAQITDPAVPAAAEGETE